MFVHQKVKFCHQPQSLGIALKGIKIFLHLFGQQFCQRPLP